MIPKTIWQSAAAIWMIALALPPSLVVPRAGRRSPKPAIKWSMTKSSRPG